MKKRSLFTLVGIVAIMSLQAGAQSKSKNQAAYIGYVYPAGGQRGSTFQVRIGGQRLEGSTGALVSGKGVHVEQTDCLRKMGNQMIRLMREQLKLIKNSDVVLKKDTLKIQANIQKRIADYVRQPASQSLATVVLLEVTIDKNATPGPREIRVMTPRGISNPLVFHVGRLQEFSRPAMKISKFQTLGKEHLALRDRPDSEVEKKISLPCTVNGQIASGEMNRYRFSAGKGDRLVITTLARQLVPYIADAVPGWFQPVITLYDANGTEMAFNDDFRFNPDPTLLYEVPKHGEYILSIHDSIYRGREDFVYRMTLGETPFITEVFPAGMKTGQTLQPKINGWNLEKAVLTLPELDAKEGLHLISADRKDTQSNYIPFRIDTLPERTENRTKEQQHVSLPVILNGRIDRPGDQDTYTFKGMKGKTLIAEVHARRLDSPLDSIIKLTAPDGKLIAFNDDHSDPGSGLNTHHADSYLRVDLPATGTYSIQITDISCQGGPAYTYRLRLSPPRPDFALRTVPSHIDFKGRRGSVEVFAIRKDGYNGPIHLQLEDPPEGITVLPATLAAGKEKVKLNITCNKNILPAPLPLQITGTANIDNKNRTHQAIPAEDWMQAFLWRHLVPAQQLLGYRPAPSINKKRPLPGKPDVSAFRQTKGKKLTSEQKKIAGRVRQVCQLYQEWMLTDELYIKTVKGLLNPTQQER